MKKLLKFTGFFLLFFAFQYVSAAPQQIYSPLHDPHIQSGENLSYLVVNKKGSVTIKETVELDKSGRKYLIRVTTPLIYRELALLRETMTPVELTIVTKNDNYLLTTRKSIKYSGKNQNTSKTGKLALLSASDMPYALRGFPFENPVPIEIIFINDQETGNSDAPFKVTAEAAGEESLSIAGRSIPCYIIEIKYHISGFMSLFKSMFPKTRLWYSKASPHYLVKYENKGGQGSTENMVMTIADYSGWN